MADKRQKVEEKAEQTGAGVTVAITGVSGYIGGVLAKRLLERGYTVRGTVRSLDNAEKTAHLKEGFPGLELYEADLLKDGSFEECFKGCKFVFHAASPFQPGAPDPLKDLVEPAVHGTENVLRSALATDSVERVVLTSSCAAIIGHKNAGVPDGKEFTEDDWNEESTLNEGSYYYSKVMAEKKAWEMVKGSDKSLVTICPSFVLGPCESTRTDSESVRTIVSMLDGSKKDGMAPAKVPCVDIEDVVLGHIRAAEVSEASGRYILSSTTFIPYLTLAESLHKAFPSYPVPIKYTGPAPENNRWTLNHSKAEKELGIEFTPIEDTVVRMGQWLIDQGIVAKSDA